MPSFQGVRILQKLVHDLITVMPNITFFIDPAVEHLNQKA